MVACDHNRKAVIPQHFRGNQPGGRSQTPASGTTSPRGGYGFLQAVVAGVLSRGETLVELFEEPHRHGGNPGYPADAMLAAYVMQFALNERYANGFLNRLGSNDRLLSICGLECAPSEAAYSRFKKKLAERLEVIEGIIADVFLACGDEIERLREAGEIPEDKPPLGHSLVVDSTDVEAWARPGRTSRKTGEEIPSKDHDAKWGHRTAKSVRSSKPRSGKRSRSRTAKTKGDRSSAASRQKDTKDELYFGYKVDVITDANYGLPIFAETRPANASDVAVMVQDLDDCLALYPRLSPRYFLGDKGYDSLDNILHIIRLGLIPIVAIRRPEKDKESGKRLHDGIYDETGRPTCIGGKSMQYVETHPEKGHLFQCPAEGCPLKETVHFTRYCDSQHYEKPEGKLLRIVGLLPRCSEAWKAEYKKRPIIERFFASDKHSRLLGTHRYLNIEKMSLHVAMSMLAYLATALAHLQADDYAHMRHMRIKLPEAKGESPNRQRSPTPACHDPGCSCCTRWREAA